jgi:hypothetical protein
MKVTTAGTFPEQCPGLMVTVLVILRWCFAMMLSANMVTHPHSEPAGVQIKLFRIEASQDSISKQNQALLKVRLCKHVLQVVGLEK